MHSFQRHCLWGARTQHTPFCGNLGKLMEVIEVRQTDSLKPLPPPQENSCPLHPKETTPVSEYRNLKPYAKTMTKSNSLSSDFGHPLPDTQQTLPGCSYQGLSLSEFQATFWGERQSHLSFPDTSYHLQFIEELKSQRP